MTTNGSVSTAHMNLRIMESHGKCFASRASAISWQLLSSGRTDKDPSWTNTAAGRHFTEKHKAELMPVFPSELVRAKQKAAYYLRAICRHKQAYEFFHNGSGPLLWCCWCNNPRRPQIVNNPFGHEIQEIVLPELDSIPPAKKRRRCAAVEGAQQSEQPQLEAGPITSVSECASR